MRCEVIGAEHLDSLSSAGNLACVLEELERFDECESILRQILAFKMHKLGERHASTLTTMGNLANFHRRRGNWAEALPLLEELALGYRVERGPDDVVTGYVEKLIVEARQRLDR